MVFRTNMNTDNQIILSEEEYLASKGFGMCAFGEFALHRTPGGLPKHVRRFHVNREATRSKHWADVRERLRVEYAEKLAAGEIRKPTRIESLQRTAQFDPMQVSTHAARRILRSLNLWNDELEAEADSKWNTYDDNND
jgi:hypothetical protein